MKILKGFATAVAFVVGNAILPGIGGIVLAAGVSAGLDALLPNSPTQGGSQTKWKADPYAGLPYVMGRTLTSGNIVYRRGHGQNNVYETFVTVLSIGPIQSIDTTFMNRTTTAFDSGGNATGTYRNQIYQRTQRGLCPESGALAPPIGSPTGWTGAHKLSGLAAVMNTFKYDPKSREALTSEPTPAWIVHGAYVYDPRLDSTYPGGVGSCRALDEATYVWSDNPHLHGLTWTLGRWQNGKRVAGIGAPIATIDVNSFVEGANLCDARGWKIGGQVYTRPDTPWASLQSMLQAGGAEATRIGGTIASINRAPRVSLATIRKGDIAGACSFSGTQPRRNRINTIIPSYRSEAHDWEMVPAAPISIGDYVALDGDERTKDLPWPLVQDVDQVAQLATYEICEMREAGPGTVPLKPWWLNYRIGDCVTFAPEDGFSIKTVIRGRAIEASTAVVTYELRGETDGKHPLALGQTGIAPPIASLTYDDGVGAPESSDWTLTGAALEGEGGTIPALTVTGTVSNPSADAVQFEYRLDGTTEWQAAGVEPATATSRIITGVMPRSAYQVAISYRVRGRYSDRLVLGPETTGELLGAGQLGVLIQNSYPIGLELTGADAGTDAGTDASVTINNHTRRYADRDVAIAGATLTGLAFATAYDVYYDDSSRADTTPSFAVTTTPSAARLSADHPYRHFVGSIATPADGGAGTGGSGGGAPGGGTIPE